MSEGEREGGSERGSDGGREEVSEGGREGGRGRWREYEFAYRKCG